MKKNFLLIIGLIVTTSVSAMVLNPNDPNDPNDPNKNYNWDMKRKDVERLGQKTPIIAKSPCYRSQENHSLNPEMNYGYIVPSSASHPAVQSHIAAQLAAVAGANHGAMQGNGFNLGNDLQDEQVSHDTSGSVPDFHIPDQNGLRQSPGDYVLRHVASRHGTPLQLPVAPVSNSVSNVRRSATVLPNQSRSNMVTRSQVRK